MPRGREPQEKTKCRTVCLLRGDGVCVAVSLRHLWYRVTFSQGPSIWHDGREIWVICVHVGGRWKTMWLVAHEKQMSPFVCCFLSKKVHYGWYIPRNVAWKSLTVNWMEGRRHWPTEIYAQPYQCWKMCKGFFGFITRWVLFLHVWPSFFMVITMFWHVSNK